MSKEKLAKELRDFGIQLLTISGLDKKQCKRLCELIAEACRCLDQKPEQPEFTREARKRIATAAELIEENIDLSMTRTVILENLERFEGACDQQAEENKRLQFEIDRLNSTEFVSHCRSLIKQIEQLQKQIEQLQAEKEKCETFFQKQADVIQSLLDKSQNLRLKIEQLQADNERLKEALKKYGKHLLSCNLKMPDIVRKTQKNSQKNCTCGFEQALKEKGGG